MKGASPEGKDKVTGVGRQNAPNRKPCERLKTVKGVAGWCDGELSRLQAVLVDPLA